MMAREKNIGLKAQICAAALILCAVYTNADKCQSGCQGVTPNIFKYQDGTTYKYNFESTVDISLSSAEGQHTSTKILGTALLTQQPDCNQVLRLQNVQVVGPDAKKHTGLENIEKPIRLNFHDGHLEATVCTDPSDTQHSLNIKRAVASLFQAALGHHGDEEDVFGKCKGDISQRKEGNNIVIRKKRDLTKCSNREAIRQDFTGTSFNLRAVAGTGPVFANYESEQRIKNGILDHATVTEDYLYKPFSDGKAHGAKATVTTKLTSAGTKKENVAAKVSLPRSINFEAPHQETVKSANVDSILNALKETKKTMDISVSEKSAETFLQLIKVLRASRKEDILAVYGQVKTGAGGFKDKDGARKVFFDALFRTGTGEAVEVIVELLKNKELSAIEQKLVYLSLSFIRHATKGSLASVTALLDQPDLPREAYLGIGSLAGRYCSDHPCTSVDELQKLTQKLSSKLTATPTSRKHENEAIAALKALANIGKLSDSVADKISAIYLSNKAPTRLRVAALEVAASDACHQKILSSALSVLKNKQEDSEVRIKGYLVLVECPDQKIAQGIKEVVEHEPTYQVGGYITSHLRNLRASTNPSRERAQQYLSQIRPTKQYPIDPRKYSLNQEVSYSWDTLGAAGVVDADVIYSHNSWLPRSVGLNVSGDVLGHSYPFVEIDIRQENLDKVVEHYLGPLGVLREHSPEELLKTGKQSVDKIVEHIKQRYEKSRGKRDISKNEIDAFAKTIKVLGSDFNKDLDLDLNIKLFGSELLFLSLNEDIHKLSPDVVIDKLFDGLDQGVDKAKNFEYHLKNHLLLADVEVVYPTSAGLALRWSVQGTAAVHFITSGAVDIRQIIKDPQNAQIHLKLIPSANIEITGGISVDSHFVSTGLKVTANLLTSTGSDLTLKLLNNKGVDIKLGLPVEKQKIISFSHHLEFSTQELGKPEVTQSLKFKDKPREFSICFDQLSPIVGLTFCGEFSAPSSLASNHVGFPLNGNVNLEVSIEREDVSEYHFRAELTNPGPETNAIELTFDTPNSKNKRFITLILELQRSPKQYVRATLKSSVLNAVAEVVVTDTATEKSILARFQQENQEYLAKIGVSVKKGGDKHIYEPLIELQTPADAMKTKGNRKPDYTVEGQIIVENPSGNYKYTLKQIKLISPGQPPVQINGFLAKEGPTSYSTDLQVQRDSVSVSGKGKLQYSPQQLKINAEVQNSVNPNANFNVKLDLKKGERQFENSLILIHGADLSSKKHQLTLAQSFKYVYENNENFDLTSKNKLQYPLLGVDLKVDFHGSPKHYSYDVTLGYDKMKLASELDAKVSQKTLGDYDIEFELEVINNELKLKAKREIEGDKSKVSNELELSGRKYKIDGIVQHHVKPNDINIGTDLVIKIHEKSEPIKVDTSLVSNSQNLDSHAKILIGSNAVVDIIVKGSRAPNPSGTLKVVIQNIVNANGNFKMSNGKGSGQIVVEIPKANRKLKAEGQITCQAPIHNGQLNIYFDFEKDNSKKLHIESNNEITKESFDTKNKVDLLGQVVSFNSKGQLTGSLSHGTQKGQFDLTLPNNDVISGNLDRQITEVDHVMNGKIDAALQHKRGDKVRKIDAKGTLKDTNPKKGVFDIEWNFVASESSGKDVKFDLILKHHHDGDKHNSQYKGTLHGSLLPKPLTSSLSGVYTRVEGTHEGALLYGANGIKVHEKYNGAGLTQPGQPISGALDVEVLADSDKYKNVKIGVEGRLVRPEQPDGVYEAEGSLTGTLNNENTVKLSGVAKSSIHKGELKLNLESPSRDPLTLAGKYSREKTEKGGKMHGELDLKYLKDKEIKAGLTLNKISEEEGEIEIDLLTPSEAAKNINLKLKTKRSTNNKHLNNQVILTADGKKYSASNELVISEINPSLDIIVEYPDGKQSRIFATFNRLGPKDVKGEIKVISVRDFSLEASGEANIDSVDDFHIVVNVDSEKLKLHKVRFEASNKPAKGGKKIQFSAKSGDKNLLSGSTSYKANEEGGKFIVEGSGSVKIKDETRTATFKFIKQELEEEKNGEQGIEILLNAGIGSQGIDAEFKLTNKQFRVLNSYCEEKKQCAHVEVFSKTNSVDAAEFNHELEINIDLRKLGLSHEFGLKSVTSRKDFVLDHTVDIHFESSAASKYQYSLYIHPKEAGIQFTTPKRVISLEGKGDLSGGKGKQGTVKAEIALYLNKNAEPNKKTLLSYTCNHQVEDQSGNAHIEVKLSSPGVSKDLLVSYTSKYDIPSKKAELSIELDIFAKKNQKIHLNGVTRAEKIDGGYKVVTDFSLGSKGLNVELKGSEIYILSTNELGYILKYTYQREKTKYDDELLLKLNPKKVELLVKTLNKNIIHIDSNLELSKDSQIANTKVSLIGIDDILIHAESKNFNTFFVTVAKKSAPQNKLKLSSGLIIGQIADIRLETEKGSAKTDVAHASVKLDEANFLKPDFNLNSDYIQKHLIPALEKESQNSIQKLKILASDTQKALSDELQHVKDISKKSIPNLKPAGEYYKQELAKLKDELVSDKTIQEVSELFKKVISALAHTFSEIYTSVSGLVEQISVVATEQFTKITDIISKDILPQVKEVASKLLDLATEIIKDIYDVVLIYIVKLTDLLKAHQEDIKKVVTVLSEAFQDFGRLFVKFFIQIREDIQVLLKKLYDQAKALPIFEELQQRYEELVGGLPIPEQILGVVNEFFGTVKDFLPTEEAKNFVSVVQDYIGKKLRKEKVDDTEAISQIYSALIKAVNSLIKFVQNQQPGTQDYKTILQNIVPLRLDNYLTSLPQLTLAKFSPVNLLLQGRLPTPQQLIWGQSLNPRDAVPPFRLHGILAQGQHIFTFDDRHLTFPGKCSYVLAKDAVNGNFTVAASYKDGALESITFSDKHDVVTLKANSEVTHNGQKAELPIRTDHVDVFRIYEAIEIVSKAGVHVKALPSLGLVSVYVSGFYHNQLRGLLGNGNFEPYDDFTLPNGKITNKEDDFGNSYKLQASCAAVKTTDHSSHHSNPKCDELFGDASLFKICYPFVHPDGYRQACEHGLSSGIAQTEKYIALAYVVRCQARGIPIQLPSEFVQCTNGEKPVDLNTQFSTKVPQKAADIVVVVEQNKANEPIFKDLIQPVITQLTNELNAKGINDVQFSLIGYGGPYSHYPSHITQGGKLSFHGSATALKFTDPPARVPSDTGCKYIDSALERFKIIIDELKWQMVLTPEGEAMREGFKYPFRANAAKALVWVRGETTEAFSIVAFLGRYMSQYSRASGIHVSIVQPLENLKSASGKDAKQIKSIVGFNEHSAFTLADAKKKGEGSTELRKDLDWGLEPATDYVIDRHGGNVFLSNAFTAAKGGQKKQFVQVVSHVIADDIINTEYGQDCQCVRQSFAFAKNMCRVVTVKEKEPRKGAVKG